MVGLVRVMSGMAVPLLALVSLSSIAEPQDNPGQIPFAEFADAFAVRRGLEDSERSEESLAEGLQRHCVVARLGLFDLQ